MKIASGALVRRTAALLAAAGLAATLGNACGAGGDSGGDPLDPGTGGSGAGSGTGGSLFDAGFDSSVDSGPCAAENHDGELVPLALYIMQDQSASMDDDGKWEAVEAALQTFFAADESDGIAVGLSYFPIPPTAPIPTNCTSDPECGLYGPCLLIVPPSTKVCAGSLAPDTSCEPLDYGHADVEIQELPDVLPALQTSLGNHGPEGDATPTQPALEGAIAYATAWAQAHPTYLTYIVFATDGEPTGCTYNNSIDDAATAAAAAAAASPSVKTFVIGVGVEIGNLNQIAQAGQTEAAYKVDTGPGATQAFIDKLVEIRAAGQCKFTIPVPTEGDPDYGRVNVKLVDPDDPNNPHVVLYVASEGACDATNGGWYYDDPNSPHMIILCPATCEQVRTTDWAVQVELGCTTITN